MCDILEMVKNVDGRPEAKCITIKRHLRIHNWLEN